MKPSKTIQVVRMGRKAGLPLRDSIKMAKLASKASKTTVRKKASYTPSVRAGVRAVTKPAQVPHLRTPYRGATINDRMTSLRKASLPSSVKDKRRI